MIDPRSAASHCITPYAFAVPLGIATGFVVQVGDVHLLLTNYHVVSGCHPNTGRLLPDIPARPDRLLIPMLWRTGPRLSWRPMVQLLTKDDRPLWIEHPSKGRRFDVVALPLRVPEQNQVVPYDRAPGPPLALHLASEVAVIGFPEGMTAPGLTAIWKSGTLASEMEVSLELNDFFWIDSNTRRGMSGAPVIARRFGGALMENGSYAVGAGVTDRVLGVYAGRALDAPDMTLGRVWGWAGVQELIDHAAAEVLMRRARPFSTTIGHLQCGGMGMPSLDVRKSVAAEIRLPNGSTENKTFTVGEIIRDFVLADDRFGTSLERVRMAAAIDSAIVAAETGTGSVELDPSQYSVICECIEKPTKGMNPLVARHILPLLDYILSFAGTP